MGNNESNFASRMASGNQGAFQSTGNKIMQIAEAIRPYIAEWLQGAKTRDGMPVQPATVRAVALNTAQILVKKHV